LSSSTKYPQGNRGAIFLADCTRRDTKPVGWFAHAYSKYSQVTVISDGRSTIHQPNEPRESRHNRSATVQLAQPEQELMRRKVSIRLTLQIEISWRDWRYCFCRANNDAGNRDKTALLKHEIRRGFYPN
ncbi:hypothetical protein Tcan_01766, partial [Toxocara canis]